MGVAGLTHAPTTRRGATVLILLLLIIAAVCFAAATVNVPTRLNLIGAGLFAWVLTVLIPHLH